MAATMTKNIRQLSLAALEEYLEMKGEPKFRAKQLYEWLWLKPVQQFDDMTNLSKQLREHLKSEFVLPALSVDTIQTSEDGTVKTRFKTWDQHLVEGCLDPYERQAYGLCFFPDRLFADLQVLRDRIHGAEAES